eukprot:m.97808 g.97808  ORF g.97808 m.97808 type:complete len:329 (+) comp15240_c0_seq2:592-1578(+)
MVRDITLGARPSNPPVNRGGAEGDWMKRTGAKGQVQLVEVAERVVSSLMPLLDAMHDVANGSQLSPGSSQRRAVESAMKSLPVQLSDLLQIGSSSSSAPAAAPAQQQQQSASRVNTFSHATRTTTSQPAPQSSAAQDAGLDEAERRMRAEKERQARIKARTLSMRGVPPPNVRLLEYGINTNTESGRAPEPEAEPEAEPEPEAAPAPAPVAQEPARAASISLKSSVDEPIAVETVPRGMDWRTALKTKKQREQMAREQAEKAAREAEEQKWSGVPAWKRALLESKARKKEAELAPVMEQQRRDAEAQARFNALPPWKQKLLLERQGAY